MDDYLIVRNERDGLVAIGLLARAYQKYDPSIPVPNESAPTHSRGLNIYAAIVDNNDGELLGMTDNCIHNEGNPLQHAEQRALREALSRVKAKRPKPMRISWEKYYRTMMFMDEGNLEQSYVYGGSTLYTTLEPCPMCSSSSLVSRVKRLVYLIDDTKYGNAWPIIKEKFYKRDEVVYTELRLDTGVSPLINNISDLLLQIRSRIKTLREQKVRDTLLLDYCREELSEAFDLLCSTSEEALVSVGDGREISTRTLTDLKSKLGILGT